MIRSFGPRDLLTIRRLAPQGVAFDLQRVLLSNPSPILSSLAGYLTHDQLGAMTYVLDGSRGSELPRGFVQAWAHPRQARWDVSFLAPGLDFHPKSGAAWLRLLTHLTVRAAQAGIRRVYARSIEDAEAEDLFRQTGYTVVFREEVFATANQQGPAVPPRGLRRVSPQDWPALQALCREVVPQLVQQAEGHEARFGKTRWRARYEEARQGGFLWTDRGRAVAFLGLRSSKRGYWLEVIVRPEYRADLSPYIRYILSLVECSPTTPLYCPVPEYSVGLGWVLRTLGFEPYARQVLMVVHTVAQVRVQRELLLQGMECAVETIAPIGGMAPTPCSQPATYPEQISRERVLPAAPASREVA